MKASSANSERGSEPTSPNAPKTSTSEADYLARQAESAKTAISTVVSKLKDDLAGGVDPRLWTQTHPWASIATAALAGFTAAAIMVPSKEQQALRRLAAIEKALLPKPEEKSNGDTSHDRQKSSILSVVLREGFSILAPAIASMFTAKATVDATNDQPDAEHS